MMFLKSHIYIYVLVIVVIQSHNVYLQYADCQIKTYLILSYNGVGDRLNMA